MILVTGATGHVGNVLVRQLLARGDNVRALVLPDEACQSLEGLDVERVTGNVLDPASLDRAMMDVTQVYHLAGIIAIMPGAESLMQRVNVEGPRNVAQAALRAGVQRMVHVSSVHAFARIPVGSTLDEAVPFAPDNPAGVYDRTKAQGTLAVLDVVKQGLDAVIACPTGIIGPHDYMGSEMGQVVLDFARRRLHLLIEGAFDFVDVRDVAHGLVLATERGQRGETYILSGTHVTLMRIHDLVQDVMGMRTPRLVVPFALAKGLAYCAEVFYRLACMTPRFTRYSLQTVHEGCRVTCDKAEEELGYRARPLCETIADTLAWHASSA